MQASDLTVAIDDGILNVRVGAIIMKNNKILMVGNERSDYFYSVGGRIKFGESAEDAVTREVLEETGIHMEVEKLGFIHENFFMGDDGGRSGKRIYEISFFFYMKVPADFELICESFTEDHKKEYLVWLDIDTDKKYFPEFFKEELGKPFEGVKHFVTRDCN